MDPRPYQRTDHPHHVGLWLNFGNVNGLDFWNNSIAAKPAKNLTWTSQNQTGKTRNFTGLELLLELLTEKYKKDISCVLSCYDRIIINGTMPEISYSRGMTNYMYENNIRIFVSTLPTPSC